MMSGGKVGVAVLLIGGGVWAGCGSDGGSLSSAVADDQKEDKSTGDVSHTDLMVTAEGGGDLTCPSPMACFDVSSEKNITHIFVQVGFDGCAKVGYSITVDGKAVTMLHTMGGPCNVHGQKGEDLIPRDVWFPLPGNQKTARVCVATDGTVPASIRVGAKSAEECKDAMTSAMCQPCEQPQPCPDAGSSVNDPAIS